MTPEEKRRLARTNDIGLEASAIRLRAARKVAGKEQREIAREAGLRGQTPLSNAENGETYPSRQVLATYWQSYRIDFNFMINGDYAQLPADVQDAIFPALEAATREWARREDSGRRRNAEGGRQDETSSTKANTSLTGTPKG